MTPQENQTVKESSSKLMSKMYQRLADFPPGAPEIFRVCFIEGYRAGSADTFEIANEIIDNFVPKNETTTVPTVQNQPS